MKRLLSLLTADDGDEAARIYEARLSFKDAARICAVLLALAPLAMVLA